MISFRIETEKEELVPISHQVLNAVDASGIQNGICVVYCPHTTAGITINENTDPHVQEDILLALNRAFPSLPEFKHGEGNSSAHIKASVMGSSVTIPIRDGALQLYRWQGIFFCEFDGPRDRQFYLQLIDSDAHKN